MIKSNLPVYVFIIIILLIASLSDVSGQTSPYYGYLVGDPMPL